jgi:hypothetical protein
VSTQRRDFALPPKSRWAVGVRASDTRLACADNENPANLKYGYRLRIGGNKMVKRLQLFVLFFMNILLEYSGVDAADVDFQKQYEAAVTKIFVSQQYKAIPIFRLNPLNPGMLYK